MEITWVVEGGRPPHLLLRSAFRSNGLAGYSLSPRYRSVDRNGRSFARWRSLAALTFPWFQVLKFVNWALAAAVKTPEPAPLFTVLTLIGRPIRLTSWFIKETTKYTHVGGKHVTKNKLFAAL